MAENASSGSSSLLQPLSNSDKGSRSPRTLSPRLANSDKGGKSPRAGRGEGSSIDDSQVNNDAAKMPVSPRSAPLALLVKNLGIRPVEADAPFEPPSATTDTPAPSTSTGKKDDDDDWDDGPDSRRSSTIGVGSSSSGLNLKVNDLPAPDGLFDPTPREEPAKVEEQTPPPAAASPSVPASASAAASSAAAPSEPATPTPVASSGSVIASSSGSGIALVQPSTSGSAIATSETPTTAPAVAASSSSSSLSAETQPAAATPTPAPAAAATTPVAATPAPAAAPPVPATSELVGIPAAVTPAQVTTDTAVAASSPPTTPTAPSWSSGKVEQLAAADKTRPLSAELVELRKLQAEVRRLKSNTAAAVAQPQPGVAKSASGSAVVASISSPPAEAASTTGTSTSPRSASAAPAVSTPETSATPPAVSSVVPPTAAQPAAVSPAVPTASAQPTVPAVAAAVAPTPPSKQPGLPLFHSPPFIKKGAAEVVTASAKPSAAAPTAPSPAVAPTPPPALAKPLAPKGNKKGDAKPSVFSLFGVGGDAAGTPAPAAGGPTPAPAAPPQKPRSAITNLHEPVRMKATPATSVAKDVPCRICQSSPMTHFFQPCGHRAACLDCATEWLANVRTCPLCSSNATSIALIPAGIATPAVPTPPTEMGLLSPSASAPASSSPASAALMGSPPPSAKAKHQQPQLTRYASIRQVGLFQYLTAAGASPEQLQEVEKIDITQPTNVTSDIKKVDEKQQQVSAAHFEEDLYNQGVKLFNEKPKKGLEFLISKKLLEKTAEDVAEFLYTCEELDKVKIGEMLGEPDAFHMDVLRAFVASFDFRGLDFDIALRKLLFKFRLPGEAQKIDRVMNSFAVRYYLHNKTSGVFKSSDAVYVLAFAVIMLNTDLHNPQVKKKMSKSDFLKNNRGINEGENLPEDFLEDLYERIKNDEIKMKTEGGKWATASKKGWLTMRKGKDGDQKQFWFILCDGKLHWMRRMGDEEVLGNIPLSYFKVQNQHPKTKLTFHLVQAGNSVNPLRYHFLAPNERELTSWVNLLQAFDPLDMAV